METTNNEPRRESMGKVVGWTLSFADAETQEGFLYALGVAERISSNTVEVSEFPGDRETARYRLAKLTALRGEVEREIENARDLDTSMRSLLRRMNGAG